MARSTDALRRDTVAQQASGVGASIAAPRTNAALQLAQSLQDIEPSARDTLLVYAKDQREKATAQARHDALVSSGAKLGDAVRDGTIEPTQNPWYVQAYSRESAAVRGQSQLSQLTIDSATWAEKNDPAAFATKWRAEVGKIAEGYASKDEVAGFAPVEAQFTQQALQSNTSQNVTRIIAERDQNHSQLLSSDLGTFAAAHGGTITADQAGVLFQHSREGYLAVGGSQADWNNMAVKAVTSAAYATKNPGLLDLLHAPELVHGPSGQGAGITYGSGASDALPPPAALTPIAPVAASEVGPARRWSSSELKAIIPFGGRFTSGERSAQHNAEIGGAPGSQHVAGTAIDVVFPKGTTPQQVRDFYASKGAAVDVIHEKAGDAHSTGDHFHIQGARHPQAILALNGSVSPAPVASVQSQDTPALAAPAESVSPSPSPTRGPSLYDIAGVADQVESDKYRIQQGIEGDQQSRLRALTMDAKIQGTNAYNAAYAAHGTALLTGAVSSQQLIQEMTTAGYKPQAIAQALQLVRGDLQDNAGVATARLALNGANPAFAKQVMDLQVGAARDGLTDGLATQVGSLVLSGQLSGDDGAAIVTRAINRSRALVEENRSDTNYKQAQDDRRKKATATTAGYKALKTDTGNTVSLLANTLAAHGKGLDVKKRGAVKAAIQDAAGAWLALHPDDFAGARAAARNKAVEIGNAALRGGQRRPAQVTNGQTNSRRGQ